MKLLFDQNLSPKLVAKLGDLFPGSDHVYALGLDAANDREIRAFAGENEFIVVTKDADYGELNSLYGAPPKVIWIRRGNCSTVAVERILRDHWNDISRLANDAESGVLTIY
jgi:predicted nuclease of predicted toxin-antitoxin system